MRFFVIAGIVLAFAACSQPANKTSAPARKAKGASAIANGRTIFMTGRDAAGVQLTAVHPALRGSCAACHGADGAGGLHLPSGAVSADLRHAALVTHQKRPYTVALLERAISTGIDNMGQPLNPVMPRWRMSRRDLHDVSLYVLTKLK